MQLLMRRPEITGFISIAPQANLYDFAFLAPCPASGLFIHGTRDQVVPEADVQKLVDRLSAQRGHQDHLLQGRRREPLLRQPHARGGRSGGGIRQEAHGLDRRRAVKSVRTAGCCGDVVLARTAICSFCSSRRLLRTCVCRRTGLVRPYRALRSRARRRGAGHRSHGRDRKGGAEPSTVVRPLCRARPCPYRQLRSDIGARGFRPRRAHQAPVPSVQHRVLYRARRRASAVGGTTRRARRLRCGAWRET